MDMKTASKRREAWGDKQCDHGHIEKEDPGPYGQWSGDWVCTNCGLSLPRKDFDEMQKKSN